MKKSLLALTLAAASGSAFAGPFYLDLGENKDGFLEGELGKACDTCTSIKDEFTFAYQSSTTIFDTDLSGDISVGDGVSTNGGLSVGGLTNNLINGFLPESVGGNPSNNYYNAPIPGNTWVISFSMSNLEGMVTNIIGDVPMITYGPGLLELYVSVDGGGLVNFMDIDIKGAQADGLGTLMLGSVDFTSVDASYNNLFHSANYECNGKTGFYDIWNECGDNAGEALEISFVGHFDTGLHISQFGPGVAPNTFALTSNHEGSGTFNVPEPSTVALLGGSLLMMGAMARRRKQQA